MNALVREHGGSRERWVESSCGETSARGADAGVVASATGPGDRTGRAIGSRRTSRIERMRRWTRSQGCCKRVSVTRGIAADRLSGLNATRRIQ